MKTFMADSEILDELRRLHKGYANLLIKMQAKELELHAYRNDLDAKAETIKRAEGLCPMNNRGRRFKKRWLIETVEEFQAVVDLASPIPQLIKQMLSGLDRMEVKYRGLEKILHDRQKERQRRRRIRKENLQPA